MLQLGDNEYLFSSESVTEGHPDKMADQISDAVLDAILKNDPTARVACETMLTTGLVVVSGEISTSTYVDIPSIVRDVVCDIGYTRAKYGFDGRTCGVMVALDEQSPDIAQGVNAAPEQRTDGSVDNFDTTGAGDQGMMFGYACTETPELIPLPITLAHQLAKRLAEVRKNGTLPYLRPDGKSQVTIRYADGAPVAVDTVLISTQHAAEVTLDQIERDITEHVIRPVLGKWWTSDVRILVNPTGLFVLGGPHADTGLTGRKIIVDTYGGTARHGGGAFSGKDPTKVDRSAAYAARWVAKNVVAAGLAQRCEVQLAYAIGVAQPVSLMVETFGTSTVPAPAIVAAVRSVFDLRPAAIIETLVLRRPIYRQTAAYGHFGRTDVELPWERLDRVDELCLAVARTTSNTACTETLSLV
ncbi:MAG: methionine adenosyltransferase [Thermoleophilia bacterium]|nr:methionine adenosyltransferase [Thermoleophilia bacterium]